MRVAVYDTYARSGDGNILHFDVLVPEHTDTMRAYEYAKRYAESIDPTCELKQARCNFCHVEQASDSVVHEITTAGHSIIPLEGCPT